MNRWDGPAAGERLLVLAPHPDDETLAAGCLMQRAVARGGEAIAVFATDGENNPWTQRLVERRLRVRPEDCARFGRVRRGEALAALEELGLPAGAAVFLGFPDQAITDILLAGGGEAIARIERLLRERRPTLLVSPCLFDRHPDHSALAVLTRLAVDRLEPALRPRLLSYLVHGAGDDGRGDGVLVFEPQARERERKRRAIERHATQLAVHRRKYFSFSDRPEIFYEGARQRHPVRGIACGPATLSLDVRLRPRPGSFGRPTLHLAASAADGARLSIPLRWRPRRRVVVPLAALNGSGGAGAPRFYVKLERRFGFFDEGGWLEIDPASLPRQA